MNFDIPPQYNENANFEFLKKNELSIPNLLLSYVYFLNNSHTTYINVGFDTDNFEPSIILYKNIKHLCFSFTDWINLYTNIFTINNFFQNKDSNVDIDLPINSTQNIFKLCTDFVITSNNTSSKQNVFNKYLICENTSTSSQIVITEQEWNTILDRISFLQSVVTWYELTSKEIKNYYKIYAEKCSRKGVTELSSTEYFLPTQDGVNYNTYFNCNYSRLYSEIPILCKSKLIKNITNNV